MQTTRNPSERPLESVVLQPQALWICIQKQSQPPGIVSERTVLYAKATSKRAGLSGPTDTRLGAI